MIDALLVSLFLWFTLFCMAFGLFTYSAVVLIVMIGFVLTGVWAYDRYEPD